MGISAWERQRDLLLLKKVDAEKDLAELRLMPRDVPDDALIRVERLINIVKAQIARYTLRIALAEKEMKRGDQG